MKKSGLLIREARLSAGISQTELANKLKIKTGQYISNVERGLAILSLRHAKKVCKLLKIKPESFKKALIEDYSNKIAKYL